MMSYDPPVTTRPQKVIVQPIQFLPSFQLGSADVYEVECNQPCDLWLPPLAQNQGMVMDIKVVARNGNLLQITSPTGDPIEGIVSPFSLTQDGMSRRIYAGPTSWRAI